MCTWKGEIIRSFFPLSEGFYMAITNLQGVSNPRVKFFSHDGGVSPADFTILETAVNAFFIANPTYRIFAINYEMFERTQPSPDLYTKVVVVTYKV